MNAEFKMDPPARGFIPGSPCPRITATRITATRITATRITATRITATRITATPQVPPHGRRISMQHLHGSTSISL
jgi:hypothetical protein